MRCTAGSTCGLALGAGRLGLDVTVVRGCMARHGMASVTSPLACRQCRVPVTCAALRCAPQFVLAVEAAALLRGTLFTAARQLRRALAGGGSDYSDSSMGTETGQACVRGRQHMACHLAVSCAYGGMYHISKYHISYMIGMATFIYVHVQHRALHCVGTVCTTVPTAPSLARVIAPVIITITCRSIHRYMPRQTLHAACVCVRRCTRTWRAT